MPDTRKAAHRPDTDKRGRAIPIPYEEYERIYDPVRLGNSGQESHVSGGPTGQGTGEQVETGRGLGKF